MSLPVSIKVIFSLTMSFLVVYIVYSASLDYPKFNIASLNPQIKSFPVKFKGQRLKRILVNVDIAKIHPNLVEVHADDCINLIKVNGKKVASTNLPHCNWEQPTIISLKKLLKNGKNIIELNIENFGGTGRIDLKWVPDHIFFPLMLFFILLPTYLYLYTNNTSNNFGFASPHLSLILIIYSVITLLGVGSVSPTYDERDDMKFINCSLNNRKDCKTDLTQARLPYNIHIWASKNFEDFTGKKSWITHYFISYIFGFCIVILIFYFCLKRFNTFYATLCSLLLILSPSFISSARMLVTHSNIILMFFIFCSVITLYRFLDKPDIVRLLLLAFFSASCLASNLLGAAVFGIILVSYLFFIIIKKVRFKLWHLIYIPICIGAFFILSPAHQTPTGLKQLNNIVKWGSRGHYRYWNYFGANSSEPQWWFSLLIFIFKTSPIFSPLVALQPIIYFLKKNKNNLDHFLFSLTISIFGYLLTKPILFKYSAPHHQSFLTPIAYLVITSCLFELHRLYITKNKYIKIKCSIVALVFFVHLLDVLRFHPNYIFYGNQFNKKLIGEFYGPAVLHCQDLNLINRKIAKLTKISDKIIKFHGCPFKNRNFVEFNDIKDTRRYRYAVWDYLNSIHLQRKGKKKYMKFLNNNCKEIYSYTFPLDVEAYKLYRCFDKDK